MAASSELPPFFHPLLRRWFAERVGRPTEIQTRAWPVIAAGEHALVTAPTGSGKTLTAFLWALQQLLTGKWDSGAVRVLYVSPLKALGYDIERNLTRPLEELGERFREAGEPAPPIRVGVRTGDTPAAERQRMARRPPEILITTPESLNILLTSRGGRRLLGGLATVILDEIHAVAGNKRGTHLLTAVERLVPLAGELQRIGISATVRPLERVAELVGGYRMERRDGAPEGQRAVYHRRPVRIVRSTETKRYEVKVCFPEALAGRGAEPDATAPGGERFWPAMAEAFGRVLRGNRSTLLFCNSRRLTERITRLLNDEQPRQVAYSHHGSLAREIRTVVEQRFKDGELAAIVATSSLELGIDIGDLDEVVLVQTPPTVAAAVQRVGRAGHGVGQVSRGRLYPTHGRDFLDAAVVARAILDQDIEEIRPVSCPLDVLAQVILSMLAAEPQRVDDLLDRLRCAAPYRALSRKQMDLVLEMLAGRYADSRLRDLQPRVSIDRVEGTVRARPGVARRIYSSGGTIPDRGYFTLRHVETKARIGELDEEFVWERSVGDTFTLGAQSWRVERVTHNDVLVSPAHGAAGLAPFWRADERDRDFHLSERVGRFLEEADAGLGRPEFETRLAEHYRMEPAAAGELLELLKRQREVTGCGLPHHRHLVVERYQDPAQEAGRRQVLLHTFWGGRVNRPLAMALAAAWEERCPYPLEVVHDDDCINLVLPESFELEEVFRLVPAARLEELLRKKLEATGFFGARFRENAARALLLPRSRFGARMPLWLNRLRAKKLLEAVSRYGDFPIVVETWRTCLQDDLDLESLRTLLGRLARGEIRLSEVYTSSPSPFAAGLVWKQTNRFMYEDDTPERNRSSALRPDLLREVTFSQDLRPRLAPDLVARFEAKLRRLAPGYAPRTAEELTDWIEERLLVPGEEWSRLLAAIERDRAGASSAGAGEGSADPVSRMVAEAGRRAVALSWIGPEGRGGGGMVAIVAVANLPRLLEALDRGPDGVDLRGLPAPGPGGRLADREAPAEALDALGRLLDARPGRSLSGEEREEALDELAAEWARFAGPFGRPLLARAFGLGDAAAETVLTRLAEAGRMVAGPLTRGAIRADGTDGEVCDSENLEILLRLARSEARPAFEPLPAESLPLFLAAHQGLTEPGDSLEALQSSLEKLFAYPAPADAWEGEILPARMAPFYPAWLDSLMQDTELVWVGCGRRRVTFAFASDLELLRETPEGAGFTEKGGAGEEGEDPLDAVLPDRRGRFELAELRAASGLGGGELYHRLWDLAWEGRVTNTSFAALRRALAGRFKPPEKAPAVSGRRTRRPPRARWGLNRPQPGSWYALAAPEPAADALEAEELRKDRARLLLERYGVLFRELVTRELPALGWRPLFRTLRLMELAGEVLAGQFFHGVPGLQFASHAAFRRLRRPLPADAVFWLGAADPASLCGAEVEGLKGELPARRPGTHLVYQGSRLVALATRGGRHFELHVGPDHPRLPEILGFLKVLLGRESHPVRAIALETINGEDAAESPFRPALETLFSTTREGAGLKLRKRYTAGVHPAPGQVREVGA